MRSVYFICVVALFMILIQGFVFVFMVDKFEHSRNDFVVTEEKFITAVNDSVENFLKKFVESAEASSALSGSSSSTFVPNCVIVDDLGTWVSNHGSQCHIDGIVYGIGDFCPYGLVLRIKDSSVYCSSSNGISILRARMRDVAPATRAPHALKESASL